MGEQVDWGKRYRYIRDRHGIEVEQAVEAVDDVEAVWLIPDPASRSGASVRVIGYSRRAEAVLTVILLQAGTDSDDPPHGAWWGANAWVANTTDVRIYEQQQER